MLKQQKLDFDILDSIRGLASLYVCIAHCRGVLWIGGKHYSEIHPISSWNVWDYTIISLNLLTRLSTEFVIVFFVLSGFSIAHSLNKRGPIKEYLKRRFIRLYPPYLIALVWAGMVLIIVKNLFPEFFNGTYDTLTFQRLYFSNNYFDIPIIIKNLLYMPQLGGIINPFWSLAYEVIFYIGAIFMFRSFRLYYLLSFLFYLFSFVPWIRSNISSNIFLSFIFVYNFYFMLGALAYNYRDRIFSFFTKQNLRTGLSLIIITYFLTLFINIYFQSSNHISYFFAAILCVLFIGVFICYNIKIKWLVNIGRYSYTLYITHFATIYLFLAFYYLFTDATPPYIYNNLIFIPAIFFCLLMAYLFYIGIEKQTKKALERLRASVI